MPKLFPSPVRISHDDALAILGGPALKIAGTKLNSPPGSWDDEVRQILLREHSYVPHDRLHIVWNKRDDTTGTAIGFAGFTDDTRVTIPVIVKNRTLAPFDTMIVRQQEDDDGKGDAGDEEGSGDVRDDKIQPLTEEALMAALDTGPAGRGVPNTQRLNTSISEDGMPLRFPYRGRTVVAAFLEGDFSSVAPRPSTGKCAAVGATKARVAALKTACENLNVQAAFLRHGCEDAVDAWLSAPEPRNGLAAKIASAAPPPVDARCLVSEPVVFSKQACVELPVANGYLAVSRLETHDLTKSAAAGSILVFSDGTYLDAAPFTLDGESKLAGWELPEERMADVLASLDANKLAVGSYVSFVFPEGATHPLKIAAMSGDDMGESLRLHDGLRSVSVLLDRRVTKAARVGDQWIMPLDTQYLVLKHAEHKPVPGDLLVLKLAAEFRDELRKDREMWSYVCDGQPVLAAVPEAKVAEYLGHVYSNAADLMAIAREQGVLRFTSNAPEYTAKTAEIARELDRLPQAFADEFRSILPTAEQAVKMAATIADPESVDTILGSGMISEDNAAEFTGLADEFRGTVGKLARLLLAIRMGYPGDEVATTVAMKSLHRVADKLDSLRGTLEES